MKKTLIIGLVLVGLFGGVGAQAEGDPTVGQALAGACFGCHGPAGNSLNPMWPKLAGQHPVYIAKQLKAFKEGARQDPVMAPMALPLDEKAMADVGAYFATVKRSAGASNPTQVAQGAKIFIEGIPAKGVMACTICHGLDGYGNPGAEFPNIASQHALYVAKALKDYRSKTRTTDPGGVMQQVAARLSDAEIDALAQYVQSLAP